jgi:hypothetical protein
MKALVRAVLLIAFAIVLVPFAIYLGIQSKVRSKARPAKPVTAADVAKAEKKLGFALPDDLKSLFMPPRPQCRVDCAELYTLGEAVAQYRMVTKSPYGPNGQDWPGELFPFADLLPGYACYDLGTGLVTVWDPEDLGEEDDDPKLWNLSFRKTGKTPAHWLSGGK